MKSRLSSTIWLLVFWIAAALFGAIGLGYYAGQHSTETTSAGSPNGALLGAIALGVLGAVSIVVVLSKRVLKPVGELAKFSERLVAGDSRARVDVESSDEFALIAENFNRSAAKVAHAVTNQQAQDSLQRSITDLLNTINQVARGDLTIRG
ncbi:MAG TPA: HAMP domain-containing protein, partial [Candidatus Acidoferrales bacterium]|nr:HAMP domain-containing protein [Candidatus Acidoferrales bacterium]